MKEEKKQLANKYDKAVMSLKHFNYNSFIRHYGLELQQGIIRLFKAMNVAPGEDNGVKFKDHSKRQISKYGLSVFYHEEGFDDYMPYPFEYEGKKYEIYYEREEYNWFHQLEPIYDYVRKEDLALLSKLYNYLQYHYDIQKKNQKALNS